MSSMPVLGHHAADIHSILLELKKYLLAFRNRQYVVWKFQTHMPYSNSAVFGCQLGWPQMFSVELDVTGEQI